jgi:hypothetical protein
MNPAKVERDRVRQLRDLPNVGPAMAKDLELIGINAPDQLAGKDPLKLYQSLCRKRGVRKDPCSLDVLISITRFMSGDEPKPCGRIRRSGNAGMDPFEQGPPEAEWMALIGRGLNSSVGGQVCCPKE